MKLINSLLSLAAFVVMSHSAIAQTMTFNGGPTEPGFTLNNWTSAGGTIWHANLATPTTCSVNSGTWNFLSFDVGPFTGANTYEVTSNLGDSYTYSGNTATTHTLNWMGVTTVTFTRISGSGAAADHDNFVYSIPSSCTDPTVPSVTYTPSTVCTGGTATLNISGTLNDATAWHIYTGSCGGTQIGTTTTGTFAIPGTINSPTTYYVRGEGGCVTPGSCGSVTIAPQALDNASFSYSAAAYCVNDADPTPTITGLGGGTFSSTAGLSINSFTGNIDVSISTPGTYTVTYTTSGTCPNSSNVVVTINPLDDASFSYSASSYCPNGSDPTPTITGLGGGSFTSLPVGLSINTSSGQIDLSASTQNSYTVTYTTSGTCPNNSNVTVSVNDNTAPLADVATLTDLTDECEITSLTAPTATDNCAGTVTGTHNATLPITSTTTVTWTYDDGNGNTSTQAQEVIITPIDNGVTVVNDITLSADASGYSYQWVDCNDNNSPISGETNQTFEATANGSYAVVIDNGDCSVTSDCFDITTVGLDQNETMNINVFPNPTSGKVTINATSTFNSIEVVNVMGQVVYSASLNQVSTHQIQLPESTGVYMINIISNSNTRTFRVIKK